MVNTTRFIPVLALLGALAAAPACASGTVVYRSEPPRGPGFEIARVAHDNGFRDGRNAGEKDAKKGRAFAFDRHDDWRDADDGYRRGYGDKEIYRREFREGFRAGYTEGYNAFARGYRR